MSNKCPHCNGTGVLPPPKDRSDELLTALRTPTDHKGPRSIYKAAGHGDEWYLTYSGNLSPYRPFSRADVEKLAARDLLQREYPEHDSCFILKTALATQPPQRVGE